MDLAKILHMEQCPNQVNVSRKSPESISHNMRKSERWSHPEIHHFHHPPNTSPNEWSGCSFSSVLFRVGNEILGGLWRIESWAGVQGFILLQARIHAIYIRIRFGKLSPLHFVRILNETLKLRTLSLCTKTGCMKWGKSNILVFAAWNFL